MLAKTKEPISVHPEVLSAKNLSELIIFSRKVRWSLSRTVTLSTATLNINPDQFQSHFMRDGIAPDSI